MMRSTLAIIAVPLLLLSTQAAAQGYVLPETVLEQNNEEFIQPSHQRGAKWNAQLESELNRQRHPSIYRDPGDPVDKSAIPPPPPLTEEPLSDDEEFALQQEEESDAYAGIDPLTARLLERLARDNLMRSSIPPVLSSTASTTGAPLAGTGPAAVLSVITMGLASLWTLRRARGLEKLIGRI